MLLALLIVIVMLGLALELASRLLAFALLWFVPILVALAAMQVTLTLYPDDPGRVFFAFVCAALVARWLISGLAIAFLRVMR